MHHSTPMFSFFYVDWMQPAAKYLGCSQFNVKFDISPYAYIIYICINIYIIYRHFALPTKSLLKDYKRCFIKCKLL